MLKDRRALLEHDLMIAKEQAAEMYLYIVTHAGNVHSKEYQQLRDRIVNLEFDLAMVNQLINEGNE